MTVSWSATVGVPTAGAAVTTTGGVDRDRLVAAAERLVEEDGWSALSVRRLGEELGVSRQVVYTHFGGATGLLRELHVRAARRLAARVQDLTEQPGTTTHVVATSAVYATAARERPALFELAFGRPVPDYVPDEDTLAVSREAFEPIIACASAWLAAGGGGGRREAVDLARVLWAVAHGHVSLELAGHADPALTDRLLSRATVAVLEGWRAGPADDAGV